MLRDREIVSVQESESSMLDSFAFNWVGGGIDYRRKWRDERDT